MTSIIYDVSLFTNNMIDSISRSLVPNLSKSIDITYDLILGIVVGYVQRLDMNFIIPAELSTTIFKSLKKNMNITEVLCFLADYCAQHTSYHPEYKKMASVICVDILHSQTIESFKEVIEQLYNNVDINGVHNPLISDELYKVTLNNDDLIQSHINFDRDYYFDYFGIKTLERSYLYKITYVKINNMIVKSNKIVERPQHMLMRVALGIHGSDVDKAFETYHLLSKRYMTHATPTLFNSGSIRPQMSSCFLLHMEDSIEGIFSCVTDIAKISKWAGGIGVTLSDIRAKGSTIRKTNGQSDGIIPLCQLLGMEGKYVNQGGKRNGSIAVYLEPYHADIFEFCELRRNTKNESNKARDLFLALWVPNLFMERVKAGGKWSLMCPDECPGLTDCYGQEFNKLYEKYENEKRFKKQIDAVDLWYHILTCQLETGMPYMLFKDHANEKSNQKNLGTIKCSNLCSEIIEYTDKDTTSVCNLASLCLPSFIINKNFDFVKLGEVAKVLVRNLDIIIDKNYYPTEKTYSSNNKHRPIGIGIQGLADVYNLMGYPFSSPEARLLNKKIFETIYYYALCESNRLAKEKGHYESFKGSPASQGILQYHMWGLTEDDLLMNFEWKDLIRSIKEFGLRNSLLTTCMPTATTAQIMGNSESIEPYLTNVFTRLTLAGEFIIINENLVNDLIKLNLWNSELRKKIIIFNGSIQNIPEIPVNIKDIYKTAFEIRLKEIITQSADRGPFIDQSQSMNLFMERSDFDVLTSAHFTSWQLGLKTGMYYLRTRPSVDPIQFGIEAKEIQQVKTSAKTKLRDTDIKQILNSEYSEESNEPKMCQWRPGIKVSECSSCT